jgi:hypothetical protein
MLMWFRVPLLALFETFLSRRTLGHILVGAVAVMVSSVALILVIAFSKGVERYSVYSYQRSRAIIGSLRVQPKGYGRFTTKQVSELERLVGDGGYHIKLFGSEDQDRLPKDFQNRIVISQSGEELRFRAVDAAGQVEIDRKSGEFPAFSARISAIKNELSPYWPRAHADSASAPALTADQSYRLVNEVREIIGHKISGLVPRISWVSMPSASDPEIRTNRHQSFPALLRQELYVASIDPDAPIFDKAFGFRLLYGEKFAERPDGKLQLGVLVNTTFLAKYVVRNDAEWQSIRSGKGAHLVPEFLYFNLPAIDGSPKAYEAGSVKVKVTGLCDLNDDSSFPHLFLTEDQGQAFFYRGERWHASYSTQFHGFGENKPLVAPPSDFQPREFKTLPPKERLEKGEGLTIGGFTHYQRAYLHVADDRMQTPQFRAEVKAKLERERFLGTVSDREFLEIQSSLNALTIPSVLRRLMEEWGAKSSSSPGGSDPDFILPPKGQGTVEPDNAGDRWTITDTRLNDKWLVRESNGEMKISKMSPFDVLIPSDTVTSTLNRIRFVVDTYATVIKATVLFLTMLSTVLFGFAHYFRKRKDLGLMKASGMSPFTLGIAFSCQVLLVAAVGFAAGLVVGVLASLCLEPVAARIINGIAGNELELSDPVKFLEVGWRVAIQTGSMILGSALVGCVVPAARASMVRPIEDLNTGI